MLVTITPCSASANLIFSLIHVRIRTSLFPHDYEEKAGRSLLVVHHSRSERDRKFTILPPHIWWQTSLHRYVTLPWWETLHIFYLSIYMPTRLSLYSPPPGHPSVTCYDIGLRIPKPQSSHIKIQRWRRANAIFSDVLSNRGFPPVWMENAGVFAYYKEMHNLCKLDRGANIWGRLVNCRATWIDWRLGQWLLESTQWAQWGYFTIWPRI